MEFTAQKIAIIGTAVCSSVFVVMVICAVWFGMTSVVFKMGMTSLILNICCMVLGIFTVGNDRVLFTWRKGKRLTND